MSTARLLTARLLPGIALLIAGCDGHDHYFPYEGAQPAGPQASVQFVHASPDAPPVDVLIDGTAAIQSLDYGRGTGEQSIAAGTHSIQVLARTPATPTSVVGPVSIDFAQGTDTVIAVEGAVAAIGAKTFTHDLSQVAVGSTRVQFLHAAPNAPTVALYLTAPGAALTAGAPFGTAAFGGSVGPTDVPAGVYEIRVTPAGAAAPVLFDSGTVSLAGGDDIVITALQNTGPGSAPVTLGVVAASGNDSLLVDVATPAELRVVHDSPNAPAISIIANGDAAAPLVASLAFSNFTAYLPLTAGAYDLTATPAGNTGDILLERNLNLVAGRQYSLYALGDLSSIGALVTRDDDRRYATQARLRIIHGAPSAGLVDVYLTAVGAGIAAAVPVDAAVPFGADTGFVSTAAGSYELTVTAAGTKTAAIGPLAVTLSDGGIYTAAARDAPGGGAPLGLILLDDFAR